MADNSKTPDLDTATAAADWPQRLHALREEVTGLVKTIPGPIASVTVRAADCSLEITWSSPDTRPVAGTAELAAVRPVQAPVEPSPSAPPTDDLDAGIEAVTAPLVGTFYLAPSPGAPPFVQVGDHVERGQNVAIVEAMKLMNHITSEWAGEVVEVVAADGEAVEFGQSLVLVRPNAG